jgi:hypothetical protein
MLSEGLIEELSRSSPSTEILVSKAWPSLTTESKLQLIFAYNKIGLESVNLPIWLYKLALDDNSEIIRIFATMYSGLSYQRVDNSDLLETVYGKHALQQEKILLDKIKKDKSEIVRNLPEVHDFDIFHDLHKVSQESRLICIRRITSFDLDSFVNNLDKFFSKISKEHQIECLDEIIANLDCYVFRYTELKNLNHAWGLLKGLDEMISCRVARILPIMNSVRERREVDAEIFLNLPPLALFWALRANKKRPTNQLLKLAKIIINDTNSLYDEDVRAEAWSIIPDDWNISLDQNLDPELNRADNKHSFSKKLLKLIRIKK